MVCGYSNDPENPFIWDGGRLNLPGDPNYPPKISWKYKFRGGAEDLSYDFTTYVDYYRV